jgi:hypothetical protein
LRAISANRKRAVSFEELGDVRQSISGSLDHDLLLFLAIADASFHALMRIGENVWPDRHLLQDYRKVIMRRTVSTSADSVGFILPGHKADRLFEGSHVLIHAANSGADVISDFKSYLSSRDAKFSLKPELWLRADGSIPACSWFMRLTKRYFPLGTAGHSFRPGGATYLAIRRTPSNLIQAIGRWTSDAFESYIRQHPSILAALLYTVRTNAITS